MTSVETQTTVQQSNAKYLIGELNRFSQVVDHDWRIFEDHMLAKTNSWVGSFDKSCKDSGFTGFCQRSQNCVWKFIGLDEPYPIEQTMTEMKNVESVTV